MSLRAPRPFQLMLDILRGERERDTGQEMGTITKQNTHTHSPPLHLLLEDPAKGLPEELQEGIRDAPVHGRPAEFESAGARKQTQEKPAEKEIRSEREGAEREREMEIQNEGRKEKDGK